MKIKKVDVTLDTVESQQTFDQAVAEIDSGTYKEPIEPNSVIIDGKIIELKSAKKLIKLFNGKLNCYINNSAYQQNSLNRNKIDLNSAEHFVLNDTVFILLGGSKLNIKENSEWNPISIKWLDDEKIGFGASVVILNNSKIDTYLFEEIKGINIFNHSTISIKNNLYLKESIVINTTISCNCLRLAKSYVSNTTLNSEYISVLKSNFSTLWITTKSDIFIEKFILYYSSQHSKDIRVLSKQINKITLKPNHNIDLNDINIHSHFKYKDKFDINIRTRLDYGKFSSVKDLNFVRCNNHDLLVDNMFIKGDKISKILNRLKGEVGNVIDNSYNSCTFPPLSFDISTILTDSEYKEFISGINNLVSVGFNEYENKHSDIIDNENKIKNTLILMLVEQIASRINLYKQLNFLVD